MTLKQRLRTHLNYRAIRRSDAVVCISENTRADLLKFVPGIDPAKIRIIYNGVSADYRQLPHAPYSDMAGSVLFVGGRQGYKNFEFLVKALASTTYNLVVCGQPLSDYETTVLNSLLPNRWQAFAYPSNAELNRIYNSVHALVYPSSYEGFGIPILEAQRAGCPAIALNASSIPEIIGDKSLLLDDLSPQELVKKLNLLADGAFRKEVVTKGFANSQRFSWQKMAQEYLALYCRLLRE